MPNTNAGLTYERHKQNLVDRNSQNICNLLNSQGVKSPLKSNIWSTRAVRTILESEIYIGANEFCGCLKHGVFPSFIDKSIFFEAQAKISRKQLTLKLRKRSVRPFPNQKFKKSR